MELETLLLNNYLFYKYINQDKTFKKEVNNVQKSSYMQTKEIIEITSTLDDLNIKFKIDEDGSIVLEL